MENLTLQCFLSNRCLHRLLKCQGSASILSPLNYNGGVYCEKGTLHRRYSEGYNRENSFSAEH